MDNAHTAAHHGHGEPSFSTKAIWRTFWILLGITCVELIIGMFVAPHFHNLKLMFNILYIFLTLLKAFYIVAEFMHLKHELKNLIMTIIVPLFLFVWFIGAFLWDGTSWQNLRNDYDPYKKSQNEVKAEKHEHGPGAKKPGDIE
jgi:cytochrome c oxidase subunit IV